jgi:hypothetical protein
VKKQYIERDRDQEIYMGTYDRGEEDVVVEEEARRVVHEDRVRLVEVFRHLQLHPVPRLQVVRARLRY